MLQPKFRNILLFLFVKNAVFALMIAFINNRYFSYVNDQYKGGGVFHNMIAYITYILIAIIPLILLFSMPIYLSFRIKNRLLFIAAILFIFALDYLFYSKWYGYENNTERFYYGITIIFFFFIFFFQPIKLKFHSESENSIKQSIPK